jgi:hypothetical protein
MIFVGDTYSFEFRTRRRRIRCALGARFYVLLFSNNTAILEDSAEHVCFVVPTHYPSFVRSLSRTASLRHSVDELFEFGSADEKSRMEMYVCGLADERCCIIEELVLK